MVRDTNRIDDALEGVTLDLAAAQSSTYLPSHNTLMFPLVLPHATPKSTLQKFVDAGNGGIR
ncbi:flagellar filament capping protein FliD, partial [Pseudomonas peli]